MSVTIRLLTICSIFLSCIACNEQEEYDYLIKNALLVDGTNSVPYQADLAIRNDTICKISGKIRGEAKVIIEAKGRILTPGFIDMHTHCDWGMDQKETKGNLNYLLQGVTTVVTGNCGYGTGEISSFKARYEENGIGTNMVPLTGFGWLRSQAMGKADRDPTLEEAKQMKALFQEAIDQGSWGLSSGLQYVPEKYSSTKEIIEIAKVMSGTNRFYTTHMRSEEDELVEATQEAIQIATEANIPLNISHLKANGRENWDSMEQVITLVLKAQESGLSVTADMYPYDKSATSALYSVLLYPESLNLKSIEDLQKVLADPQMREAIRSLTERGRPGQTNWVAKGGWNYFSIVNAPNNPDLTNKMFIDLAEEQGTTAFDIAADLVIDEGENLIISLSTMLESNLIKQMKEPWIMFSSDGSAVKQKAKGIHPRNYGSQARVIRKYIVEDKILSLQDGIFKMTGLPAKTLGLERKGIIKEGYSADLVLFDLDSVNDPATFLKPHQYAEGIDFVWVNGELAVNNGEFESVFAGKVLLATK
ncbi:MAG: amidohydrolase family protein [Bacteroidales bacterium]|nr:amidohydrolase family protein [Bacteroidales bacterium]